MQGRGLNRDIKMSLQQTTLLLLIILLLFFCMTFMITTSMISNRTEDDFQIRTSETATNNVVSAVEASLVNYNYLSRLIMINDRVVSYLKAEEIDKDREYEARSGIYEIQSLYSNIDSVYIFRNDGEYVSTGRGEYFISLNRSEYNNILDACGATVISINGNGSIRKSNDKPLLTISRAIYDINSINLIGILVMNISNDVFNDTFTLQNTSGMCILDNNGTFLCGNEEIASLYDSDYNSDNIVYKSIRIHGERKILIGRLAVKPLVVLCVSGQGLEAPPRDTIYPLILPLTAFILSGIICAWYITVNITRPIRNLSEAMEGTRSSGWLEKIDAKMPNNEIGRLAQSYDSLIEYLNELFNCLIEDEKNVRKAEMRVLHEQIKPHFLYNTLETISYMAVEENAMKVYDALETLGSFYRKFLSKGEREISLKRELEITQDYLSLQKLRYKDIFEDQYIIDDASLGYMVPKLLLQPLVENCIYHGVRPKGEKCIIRIATRMEEDGIHIMVYDSGVGMSREQIKKVLEESVEDDKKILSGFGLCGTISRIRYYCNCDKVVEIDSEPGEYTEVKIFIPKMRKTKVKGEE